MIEQQPDVIGFRRCGAVETLVKKIEGRPNAHRLVHGTTSSSAIADSVDRGDGVSEMAELQGEVVPVVAAGCPACGQHATALTELALGMGMGVHATPYKALCLCLCLCLSLPLSASLWHEPSRAGAQSPGRTTPAALTVFIFDRHRLW